MCSQIPVHNHYFKIYFLDGFKIKIIRYIHSRIHLYILPKLVPNKKN